MELTVEKSQEQAGVLLNILIAIHELDVTYMRNFAQNLNKSASLYDSTAVLNRNWNEHGHNLMLLQAKAANLICDYKEILQEITKTKELVADAKEHQKFIDKLFSI